jgi:DMSO/TMAO reductase YedYZ heme-binding membrane subunit
MLLVTVVGKMACAKQAAGGVYKRALNLLLGIVAHNWVLPHFLFMLTLHVKNSLCDKSPEAVGFLFFTANYIYCSDKKI